MQVASRTLCACLAVGLMVAACENTLVLPASETDGGNSTSLIPSQVFSELQKHSPSPALPPLSVDVSNRFADDSAAADLGHRLFFDTGFAGKLLDSDNDGVHGGVGLQGETGKVSCASCHLPASGFVDTRTVHKQLSLAAGWSNRRTPSLLDVGHARLLMWDGRFDSLQRQILSVIESPLEANSSRLYFAQEVARRYAGAYLAVFGTDPRVVLDPAYPQLTASTTGCEIPLTTSSTPTEDCAGGTRRGVPGAADYDALTSEQQRVVTEIAINAGKALAAYERKLSCGASRFDAFMHGDRTALSESEQRGATLFVGKAKCASCHSGPFFSDQSFHNVGLFPALVSAAFLRNNDPGAQRGLAQVITDPLNVTSAYSDGNDGRLPAGVAPEMLGAFRTPMLRCSSGRPSFMHTGQVRSLEEVVRFFNVGGHKQPGVPAAAILGYMGETEIAPLGLNDQEVTDLVAFLRALDGPGPSAELLREP